MTAPSLRSRPSTSGWFLLKRRLSDSRFAEEIKDKTRFGKCCVNLRCSDGEYVYFSNTSYYNTALEQNHTINSEISHKRGLWIYSLGAMSHPFYRLYPYAYHRETRQFHLARTILFHIRNKIIGFPDMVRFALLCRGCFFVFVFFALHEKAGGELKLLRLNRKKQEMILYFWLSECGCALMRVR